MEYHSTKYDKKKSRLCPWNITVQSTDFQLKQHGEFYEHVPISVADNCGQRLWQIIVRFAYSAPAVCYEKPQFHAGPRLLRL